MKSRVIAIKENPLTFYFLAGALLLSFSLYIYWINATVRNGVSYNNAEHSIAEVENKVSDLEYRYMNMRNSLTIEAAKSFGLSEPSEKAFISKNNDKPLSINKR